MAAELRVPAAPVRVEAVLASTPNEIERLRSGGELREWMNFVRPDPDSIVEVVECDVTMARSTVREARVWSPGWATSYGRVQVEYRVSPLPDAGNALIRVAVAGLRGEVTLSGDELRGSRPRATTGILTLTGRHHPATRVSRLRRPVCDRPAGGAGPGGCRRRRVPWHRPERRLDLCPPGSPTREQAVDQPRTQHAQRRPGPDRSSLPGGLRGSHFLSRVRQLVRPAGLSPVCSPPTRGVGDR
ncbi:hypothetical protein FMEAI12_4110027 [Parafrankia sp. Ea1.12]|nr:hypothetical protein FMEAI12_4110027 [Parafrankia sp. Ea1.12]